MLKLSVQPKMEIALETPIVKHTYQSHTLVAYTNVVASIVTDFNIQELNDHVGKE